MKVGRNGEDEQPPSTAQQRRGRTKEKRLFYVVRSSSSSSDDDDDDAPPTPAAATKPKKLNEPPKAARQLLGGRDKKRDDDDDDDDDDDKIDAEVVCLLRQSRLSGFHSVVSIAGGAAGRRKFHVQRRSHSTAEGEHNTETGASQSDGFVGADCSGSARGRFHRFIQCLLGRIAVVAPPNLSQATFSTSPLVWSAATWLR